LNTVPKRYGRTDGQTDRRLTVASPRSALASRGKKTNLEPWTSQVNALHTHPTEDVHSTSTPNV